MTVAEYRKKPIVIKAAQWTGDNILDLWEWVGAGSLMGPLPVGDALEPEGRAAHLFVAANNSWLPLEVGEWIIQDSLGFYPCKAEMFATTYERVERVVADVSYTRPTTIVTAVTRSLRGHQLTRTDADQIIRTVESRVTS